MNNQYQQQKTFAVIGAGPKGIAVALKAKILQEFGFVVDRIILIEKNSIAAHWSGEFGYTNGDMKLGTPPEKDLVFPIEIDVGDDTLNARIQERLLHFSWFSFLVHTGCYADWVDRGKHAPCHKLWAAYLQWVAKQLTPHVSIIYAEVVNIDLTADSNRWDLTLQTSTKKRLSIEADRLMLTGPGKTRMDFVEDNHSKPFPFPSSVYDLETFWHALKEKTFSHSEKIALIGEGEHAASVLLALSEYAPSLQVDIISPKGFIASRAESYYENQMYSEPDKNGWKTLSINDRLDFIKRTDLGVFSVHSMSILSNQKRHNVIGGRVTSLKYDASDISLTIAYQQKTVVRTYDTVIIATGFDQIAMLKSLLTQKAEKALEKAIASPLMQEAVAVKIESDFSVKDMRPYLHLPMLSGLMQGPGFSNLSCLGHLSDRLVTHFAYQKNITFLQEAV